MPATRKPSDGRRTRKRAHRPSTAAPDTPTTDHVFISYSRVDREYVNDLATWLQGHGVAVWFDHAIAYGSEWRRELEQRLDTAAAVLLVMSVAAKKSKWVERELDRADTRRIPILPVLLDGKGMLPRAAKLQFCNVSGGAMPDLRFCQKLPGFLVSEGDLAAALTSEQRAIADRIGSAVGSVRPGSKGPAVAGLQLELLRVGLDPGPVNGVYGRQTALAVRDFQVRRCHHPTADGVVGALTWTILANSSMGDLAPVATPPPSAKK